MRLDDADLVVFSNSGPRLPRDFDGGLRAWSHSELRIRVIDHHLSHAVGGFALSGFDEAIALVCDAGGNDDITQSVYKLSSSGAELIRRGPAMAGTAHGFGTAYEAFTNFLGFNDQESGKVMALAAYGSGEEFSHRKLFTVDDQGIIRGDLTQRHAWGVEEYGLRHGLKFGDRYPTSESPIAANIAAYVQVAFQEGLADLVNHWERELPGLPIVLSGGTSLNCAANAIVSGFKPDYFPSPIGSDTGNCLGNAIYGFLVLEGAFPMLGGSTLRYGRSYTDRQIERALRREPDTVPTGSKRLSDIAWEKRSDIVGDVSSILDSGACVAWFQGRSEFGPRALGGRSILGVPCNLEVRSVLNSAVKLREWFRPFGPAALDVDVAWLTGTSRRLPYMTEAPKVLPDRSASIGACVHVDGSARFQTVAENSSGPFSELLRSIKRSTGIGALLNTSFNIQEPIVEAPGDAIATFLRSKLDYLALGDYLCRRVPGQS